MITRFSPERMTGPQMKQIEGNAPSFGGSEGKVKNAMKRKPLISADRRSSREKISERFAWISGFKKGEPVGARNR
jgi:hypothetical protein